MSACESERRLYANKRLRKWSSAALQAHEPSEPKLDHPNHLGWIIQAIRADRTIKPLKLNVRAIWADWSNRWPEPRSAKSNEGLIQSARNTPIK